MPHKQPPATPPRPMLTVQSPAQDAAARKVHPDEEELYRDTVVRLRVKDKLGRWQYVATDENGAEIAKAVTFSLAEGQELCVGLWEILYAHRRGHLHLMESEPTEG